MWSGDFRCHQILITDSQKEPVMKVETALVAPTIEAIGEAARRIEDAGYDSVITPEAGHDPFLPLMIIAEHTSRVRFGTGVAIAFPPPPPLTRPPLPARHFQ